MEAAHVDTHHRCGCERVSCFFQGFPGTGLDQTLSLFQVAGWVVEPQAFGGVLLYQEKLAILLNHSSYGDTRMPAYLGGCVHLDDYAQASMVYSDNVLEISAYRP